MIKEGYIPQSERKKIMFISDDIRMSSGISTMAREIIVGTSHHFNWVNIAGAIKHPEEGKRYDLNADTNRLNGITDANIILYPTSGYGSPDLLRQLIKLEKPDALMIFTDPRYFIWLFQIENEIRKQIPLIYYNIWDNLPYPYYNKSFYESCDALLAISKQTENINKVVLGEKAKDKIIKYVPHGINDGVFFPITSDQPEYLALQEFKKRLYKNKEYDFILLYNARNIRRKSVPDLMEGYKLFCDSIGDKAKKCAFVLHTQIRDENGTDLEIVRQITFGDNEKYNIIFDESRLTPQEMNLLYNSVDCTALVSSNEGWGLSLTESMMCGKPIIGNTTGGMQDQMRFQDNDGKWIQFNEKFGSNHRKKYDRNEIWAVPVFPSSISLLGSLPTPYIYDDRCSAEDIGEAIKYVHNTKLTSPTHYKDMCEWARNWVVSDESMMSALWMCKNIIDGIDETLDKFIPRESFELIKI